MTFKAVAFGTYIGLPAIHVGPREIGVSLSIAEAINKVHKAVDMFGLNDVKRFLVIADVDEADYEVYAPFIRVCRDNGFVCIGYGSSQKYSALASELQGYVAIHDPSVKTWLNYKCSGIVVMGDKFVEPEFTQATSNVYKHYVTADSPLMVCKNTQFPWQKQTPIDSQVVML